MEIDAGDYMSIIAERPPDMIDQAFKATRAMAYKEVTKHLDLVKLYNWLSKVYPMDKEYAAKNALGDKKIKGVVLYPIKQWEAERREYMSCTNWIRIAYLLAAGHDGPVMRELREIAFAIEGDDLTKQYNIAQLSNHNILKKAQEKSMAGLKIPETKEEVNKVGRHIEKYQLPTSADTEELP